MKKLKFFSYFVCFFCVSWVIALPLPPTNSSSGNENKVLQDSNTSNTGVMIMRPREVVKKSNQNVQEILKGQKTVDAETEAKLLEIINRVTDFETISQQVIQKFCKKLTPQQCETFDQVFQRLLRVSSLKKMGRYRADKFDYLSEEMKEKTAIVKTIAYYKEEKAQLDYHLEFRNEKWMIVNYVVDDIDTVRNYKKQFMRLFAKNTFDQVMERLRKKIADYEKENAAN